MRELSGGAGGGASSEDPEEARKRSEAWEKMLVDGMNGVNVQDDALGPDQRRKGGAEGSSSDDAFQASILQAMEKLKNSDTSLHVSLPSISYWAICLKYFIFSSRMRHQQPPHPTTLLNLF